MATPSKSRYGWRWVFVLLGGVAWVSIGCSPQTLSMLVMPFTDNNVPPEYKLFAADKEITLAIVSNYARPEIHPTLIGADAELADQLINAFKKRCNENKHKIKLLPSATVRSEEFKQRQNGGVVSPVDIGKALKADYVLELSIDAFSIFEKNHQPPMYRGRTDIAVSLYKVEPKDGEHLVHRKPFARLFPATSGPIPADSTSPSTFRSRFLSVVANDVAKVFLAYPPEERRMLE